MEYQKQVDKNHYSFQKYFDKHRWMSYWYQLKEITSLSDIETILEIGPGTDFLKDALAIHRPDIDYKTLDIAEDLQPDYVGSATKIPLPDNSFDAVSAFQILEHIRFEDFPLALKEIQRVTKKYAFISLPHFGPSLELHIKIPFFKRLQFATKIPWYKKHEFGGEHYWEIGKKGYPAKKIRTIMEEYFEILDEYVPFENQYHHFFVLRVVEEAKSVTSNQKAVR